MYEAKIWLIFVLFLLFSMAKSEDQDVVTALVAFMGKLSPSGNAQRGVNWGWNTSSDPCTGKWEGITCDRTQHFVKKIVLNEKNFTGVVDFTSLCVTSTLFKLSLQNNNIVGELAENISSCKNLTHMYLDGNSLSGTFPNSLSKLKNLKRVDVSFNSFSGNLPDMSNVSGLLSFLAENNQFSGHIPGFVFSNLVEFNVSNNNLSGPIPDVLGRFNESSFSGNPGLCGRPLSNDCQIVPPPPGAKKSKRSLSRYFVYSGYAVIGIIALVIVGYNVVKRTKSKGKRRRNVGKADDSDTSSEFKYGQNRSEFSLTPAETANTSSSTLILSTPDVNGMKFEDLLRAPAELLGRGKHGSLYKVTPDSGSILVVKRIKDWRISRDDFKKRMQRIGKVTHPNVLRLMAYYCSKEEKLLVYEYQKHGSLFGLIQGSQNGQLFVWGSRLNIAASIAEALAFMHDELRDDKISHGNLKSSNILLKEDMDPCISEYGLMVVENHEQINTLKNNDSTSDRAYSTLKADIYGFGVIVLELLTGKLVHNTGSDLAKWVHSVVKEEWTAEVFDKSLILEGASEERLVSLLQVALKCINASPDARPSIKQVAEMINFIKEEEERSNSS